MEENCFDVSFSRTSFHCCFQIISCCMQTMSNTLFLYFQPTMTSEAQSNEVKRPVNPKKKMVRMASVDKNMVCSTKYRMSQEEPLPELPDCGVRVKVCVYHISSHLGAN